MKTVFRRLIAALVLTIALTTASAELVKTRFDIESQGLSAALNECARQGNREILFSPALVQDLKARAVHGEYSLPDALSKLLEGTNLRYRITDADTILIEDKSAGLKSGAVVEEALRVTGSMNPVEKHLASNGKEEVEGQKQDTVEKPDAVSKGIPEILVEGSKILNMDIQRSVDDPQPYVIFDRAAIERSGATSINDFLKTRLSMNATSAASGQITSSFLGDASNINLRGLGTAQTLILIDGRRTAPIANNGTPIQPDLNGIPLSAIERIEVLPTTASGIYGGGATGGVVNVILRRDYSGAEVKINYQNSFSGDGALRSVDFATGFTLESGQTNVLLSGSYSTQDALLNADRDFVERGRAAILANNPGFYSRLAPPILPLGSTPNIRSVNGANLVLKNSTALGSYFTFVPANYAGTTVDNGVALVANAGRYNLGLAPSRQLAGAVAGRSGADTSLVNAPTVKSLNATLRRQFGSRFQAFTEMGASRNSSSTPTNTSLQAPITLAANAPNNPFTTAVLVQVPNGSADNELRAELDSMRAAVGVIAKLSRTWTAESDYTWSRTRQYYWSPPGVSAVGNALMENGTLDILQDPALRPLNLAPYLNPYDQYTSTPFRATGSDATLRVSGPLGFLPAGRPTLSMLVEYRKDSIDDGVNTSVTSASLIPSRSQEVQSAYLEALLPVFGSTGGFAGQRLELQLAGRYDRYETNGATGIVTVGSTTPIVRSTNDTSSINPTVALRYQPLMDIAIRASYGTGFLPPSVMQVLSTPPGSIGSNQGIDPRRGNEPVVVAPTLGGNSNLEPEESQNWSAGFILTPRVLQGLRLSLDYTRIEKTRSITTLTGQQVIDNESILPGRITRGANRSTDLPGWAGPIVALDRSLANLARAKLEALDLQFSYDRDVGALGAMEFFAGATRTLSYETQIAPTTPVLENVGYGASSATTANPARLKVNGGLIWHLRQWDLGWTAMYFSSYLNYLATDAGATRTDKIANQGNGTGKIGGQFYNDVFVRFRGNSVDDSKLRSKILDRTELQAGVKNLFGKRPPFDAANLDTYYSYYGSPHRAQYYLTAKKSF